MLLLAGEREGSAPCWTEGTVRGWTCGVVRAGREVFPGGAWAWAGALNRGGRKQVPGGETKTRPAVFRPPLPRHRPPVLVSRAWSQRPSRRGAFPDLTLGLVPRRMLLGLPLPLFFFFFFAQNTYHGVKLRVRWCDARITVRGSQQPPSRDKLSRRTDSVCFCHWCSSGVRERVRHMRGAQSFF